MDAYETIKGYIEANGGEFGRWFVGVAADPKDRLVCEHSINHQTGKAIVVGTPSVRDARAAEMALRRGHGCWGSKETPDEAATFVYAFRMSATTIPGV
ncbi:MAG: hypothetical protein KIS87_05410 [Phycisphaeraceae bacterium]|nr:hypothetical protein [Phycisphaeraceae bacterium]